MFKASVIAAVSAQLVFPTTNEIVDYFDRSVDNMFAYGSSFLPAGYSLGSCPTVDAMHSFNPEQYTGIWYQAAINHASQ